jgi:hypothetical protein
MSTAETSMAMMQRLAGMSGVPDVAWPNVEPGFDEQAVDLYLEVAFFRNRPDRLTISGNHRLPGIMQVTVSGKQGSGVRAAEEMAEAIRARFPTDQKITDADGHSVRVTETPEIAGGLPDQGRWRVPVSIRFERLT